MNNRNNNTLAYTSWNCKYHIVFAPKFRRTAFYGYKKAEIGAIPSDYADGLFCLNKVSNERSFFYPKKICTNKKFVRKINLAVSNLYEKIIFLKY